MRSGRVTALWRYPVKSMQGEEIEEAFVTEYGLLGDRGYALVDCETGCIASAKHPRKWGDLLACRAFFASSPQPGEALPPVLIHLPSGDIVESVQPDVNQRLSAALGREVTLTAQTPANATREANRAPVDGPVEEDVRREGLALAAPGTFFDYAPIHLLTTATLEQLGREYPAGCFDTRRFRPNILVTPHNEVQGFVENTWLGRAFLLGPQVCLLMIDPCPRCVITTLPQGDLPRDVGILRTVAQHNAVASATLAPGVVLPAVAGVYARTLVPGIVRRGDALQEK